MNIELQDGLRKQTHSNCVVCSASNLLGLKIDFQLNEDGSIQGMFNGNSMLQGYDGMLHGGVIAALLDGAMTNCLFANGHIAVTAELTVRYHAPVSIDTSAIVRACMLNSNLGLHKMRAELTQNNCVKASALAKFFKKSNIENPNNLA
jgi:uncharacterized protein (TIGR00369 family)